MKSVHFKSFMVVILLSFMPALSFASVQAWQILPNESTITFLATQNDAPVSGKFNTFSGDLNFDIKHLDQSKVIIHVDMGSVTAAYDQVAVTLKTPDWFNVQFFPTAIFKAEKFEKMPDNTYGSIGTLTIRDKTVPLSLKFSLDEYSDLKAHAKGTTTIKRTAFGVGQGEWAQTDSVKDDVQIDFVLSVVKKQIHPAM